MGTIPAHENEFPSLLFAEGAAPANPAAGMVICYAKADGLLYCKDDAGVETAYAAASAALAAHLADTADAHDASAISVADAGAVFTGTDVEAVLAELQAAIAGGGIPATLLDAKGDLIAASAADTAARLAVGADGTILTADAAQAAGMKWGTLADLVTALGLIAGSGVDAARCFKSSASATTSTSFVDVTDQVLAVPATGTWGFEFVHFFSANATSDGIKLGASYSGTTSSGRTGSLIPVAAQGDVFSSALALSGVHTSTASAGGSAGMALFKGWLVATSTGNLQARFASEVGSNTTIHDGYGRLWRIA